MIHAYRPAHPLDDFVERFWLIDDFRPPHAWERVLPSATLDLVIDLTPGTGPTALVAGARATPFTYETGRTTAVLGIAFRPGGAAPLLAAPAGDIQDAFVPLADMWGRAAAELVERLAAAPSPRAKFEHLEQVLVTRLARARRRHPAVVSALGLFRDGAHGPSIREVAHRVRLSPRRLIQAFRAEVGLPPKLYCRVRRFGAVLQALHPAGRVEWAAVAATCGYYDQAHLIRDFRAFAGGTPAAYLAARGDNPFHIPEPR